jgi:hypothetical protein
MRVVADFLKLVAELWQTLWQTFSSPMRVVAELADFFNFFDDNENEKKILR